MRLFFLKMFLLISQVYESVCTRGYLEVRGQT